jgi:hypothetical protein
VYLLVKAGRTAVQEEIPVNSMKDDVNAELGGTDSNSDSSTAMIDETDNGVSCEFDQMTRLPAAHNLVQWSSARRESDVILCDDSDDIFGEFVAVELRRIRDYRCKQYTKLQIQNILSTVPR